MCCYGQVKLNYQGPDTIEAVFCARKMLDVHFVLSFHLEVQGVVTYIQ